MKALQYIYTSWKNGDSTEKGYMIYSRSEGITEEECTAIKDAMQYLAPKELNFAPTAQEIADVFPYSFAYFVLPTGRGCVAQSTYLGRDYSGRFGNYIIYALVFNIDELPCRPSEFFGEDFIKTYMTEEELSAPSPVPPLPPIEIESFGSVINDDQLNEFIYDKEDTFALLLTMVLKARSTGLPFYLNDTRENLVLWVSALQRVLPFPLAKKFTFDTYMFDQELMKAARVKAEGLDFCLIGVRPDANYFNYASESKGGRCFVMDLLGGVVTEGITPSPFATAMASALSMGMEDVDAFGEFLESTSYLELNSGIGDAYLYYRLLHSDFYEHSRENLSAILSFGEAYCTEEDNAEIGSKLLVALQESAATVDPDTMAALWKFVGKYSGYMIYALFDLLRDVTFQYSGEATRPCDDLLSLLDRLAAEDAQRWKDFLAYMDSPSAADQLVLYLDGHTNLFTNAFYLGWIAKNYRLQAVGGTRPMERLYEVLLRNLQNIGGSESLMADQLIAATSSDKLFADVFRVFSASFADPARCEKLCSAYASKLGALTQTQTSRFEQLLERFPEAQPFMSLLFTKKMAQSQRPEEEFWRFYERRKLSPASAQAPLDRMVRSCMDGLDVSRRESFAIDLVRRLDLGLLQDKNVLLSIAAAVGGCSFKTLSELDMTTLQRALELAASVQADGGKLGAVLVGKKLKDATGRRTADLAAELSACAFDLKKTDKTEYESYLKGYFEYFFPLIAKREDVSALIKAFAHPTCFASFIDTYLTAVKKLDKKDPARRNKLAVWTCEHMLTAPESDTTADALYPEMVRLLRSLDEKEIEGIRAEIAKDAPKSGCDKLFEEVSRKEGFFERIGRIFKKKK